MVCCDMTYKSAEIQFISLYFFSCYWRIFLILGMRVKDVFISSEALKHYFLFLIYVTSLSFVYKSIISVIIALKCCIHMS